MFEEQDADLVRRTLEGDTRAFAGLVEHHQRVLFNLALRMVNQREDARDLVQTAFLKAYRKLDSFDPRYKFFSWIYRILMNEALNLLERRRPQESVSEEIRSDAPTPDEEAERGQTVGLVRNALMKVSTSNREVLVMRHVLQLSHHEMSQAIGIPEKTVKSRLHTARVALEAVLRRQGVHSA